jgi:hypothetical protein
VVGAERVRPLVELEKLIPNFIANKNDGCVCYTGGNTHHILYTIGFTGVPFYLQIAKAAIGFKFCVANW